MPEKKKGKRKITDVTRKKELSKKQMEKVGGGALLRRVPIVAPIAPTPRPADDCNGNCMGSVPTATGEQIDV